MDAQLALPRWRCKIYLKDRGPIYTEVFQPEVRPYFASALSTRWEHWTSKWLAQLRAQNICSCDSVFSVGNEFYPAHQIEKVELEEVSDGE
jgi:hypothetical protein